MVLLTRPNTLSEQQCRELEALKRSTGEAKLYRRAKVILYRNGGYTPDEIEEHTEYSEREQRNLVRRYREEGVEGLSDRPRSGRPKGTSHQHPEKTETGESARQKTESDICQTSGTEPDSAPKSQQSPAKNEDTTLSHWARVTLESMYACHPKRYLRQRAQMLLLREKGYSAGTIADILDVTADTIRHVWSLYDRHQLAGLYRQSGSGRPSTLTGERWEQFAKWVKDGPKALGYRFVKWTTRSLRKYLVKRFNSMI